MNYLIEITGEYSNTVVVYSFYLLMLNIAAFILMSIDKNRAKKNEWRIKELTFMILALLGGAVGTLLGMVIFHHKQNKKKFYLGIPLFYIINKAASIIIYHYLFK